MPKWLRKQHFIILSTSSPQSRGFIVFWNGESFTNQSMFSCWLPDPCGFHTPGSHGRNCGTTMHCVCRILQFPSHSNLPFRPSSILGFWSLSSELNFCPWPLPQYLFFSALEPHSHVHLCPNSLWIPPKAFTCFPLKLPLPAPLCIWRTQVSKKQQ